MKKIIFATILIFIIFFAACTNHINDEITQIETTAQLTEGPWPDWGPCPEGGIVNPDGEIIYSRFRPLFYDLPGLFWVLVGNEVFLEWERNRTPEQFHNINIAMQFIQDFNISREDFEHINEEVRQNLVSRGHVPNSHFNFEVYDVDLIFSFDNERINEFFRWENSIFAHEVDLDCCSCDQCA